MDKGEKLVFQKVGAETRKLQEEIDKKKQEELYEKAWLSRDQKPDTEYNRNTTTWD